MLRSYAGFRRESGAEFGRGLRGSLALVGRSGGRPGRADADDGRRCADMGEH